MTILTAADYADTGQWRLVVNIRVDGMSAHLENTLHDDVEPTPLFSTQWDANTENLLHQVENAVYDNPRVLDDFSARIILADPRTAFMPTELVEDNEEDVEKYYTSVYTAVPADIMTETDGDVTAAFSMAPGMKSFLNRTFPGARIGCRLMQLVASGRKINDGLVMVIQPTKGEADFVLLDCHSLLSASTHPCKSDSDIVYHAFNIMEAYCVNPKDVRVVCDFSDPQGPESKVLRRHTRVSDEN